ncbi:E3 ubiquitin ISG15 ligase TRIM25-like [Pelobates cultripes]|uniref:E3 ubiquitin ISG15 ligase TRIM25-like n=1 Tax=Pelobates cultripes TaxID=61616 RepID=A0AAD1VK09_PELCU|nr:E3 ubiquitin ISG15 ligase TRIM25-like [Pelobates cultripes]
MATAGLHEELSCSICLNIYKNPVMLTCGHNFCNDCIVKFFDSQQESRIYTCPECRESFKQRPSPSKNLKLCNIIDVYQSTQHETEKVEIPCTYCVDSFTPAVKTCLLCEASLCDVHLKNHSKSSKHILIEPSDSIKTLKCSVHDELLQYFCYKDSSFLCATCKTGKHLGHQVELVNEAAKKKKTNLGDFSRQITIKISEYKMKLQQVQEQKKRVQGNAGAMKERVNGLFEDIREQIHELEKNVLQEITKQEEQVTLPLSKQIETIDRETDVLQQKKDQVERLCDIFDPLTFLKQDPIDTNLGKSLYMAAPINEKLDEVKIEVTLTRILNAFPAILTLLKANRGFFTNTASNMLLNVNTADVNIALSKDLKEASYCYEEKSRPHHPERFTTQQVLSTNKFSSGKHYWEVNTSSNGGWSVGMTYNSIKRKNETSYIGKNHKSWCLSWIDNELIAEHDDESDDLENYAPNLGIYLDYEGGILSFYELSEPITHLHTFYAGFTEPLHAAFYLADGACAKIVT